MAAIAGSPGEQDLEHRPLERRPSRMPLVLLGVVILLILGSLAYTMFARSVVYYRTATEVLASPGEQVRLSGDVVDGSIDIDPTTGTVRFAVTDGRSEVPVLFEGAAPDTLRNEAKTVAEGALGKDGVFRAETLFARCPSKFSAGQGS